MNRFIFPSPHIRCELQSFAVSLAFHEFRNGLFVFVFPCTGSRTLIWVFITLDLFLPRFSKITVFVQRSTERGMKIYCSFLLQYRDYIFSLCLRCISTQIHDLFSLVVLKTQLKRCSVTSSCPWYESPEWKMRFNVNLEGISTYRHPQYNSRISLDTHSEDFTRTFSETNIVVRH